MSQVYLWAIVGASIALMLLRPRGIAEVWWIGGGVLTLLAGRMISVGSAAKAVADGSDVYFFLIGMMLLSGLAREHGVFDWLASLAIRKADGRSSRLFALVYGIGTMVTIFLSNDATAVVLTPAILTVVRRAKVPPMPCLFACAMVANAASFVLPISNPANLVVFHTGLPSLKRWLEIFGLPCLAAIAVTWLAMRWLFREELKQQFASEDRRVELKREGQWVLAGLAAVVVIMLTASALRKDLGLPACAAALLVAGAVSIRSRKSPLPLLKGISWTTIALVAGLFVMVNAVEHAGALTITSGWLAAAARLSPPAGALATALAVAISNNLVNNLPLGLIAGATLQANHTVGLLQSAVLIGVDLGPNLSVTGSLATILWLLALRKEGFDVSFWKFLRVGLVVMPLALVASAGAAIWLTRL